ncbi:glycosyl transferase group 1 [Nitrosomonas sp. Is79A3]|uniref:glycosyltransferase n=1 Tax=Nitrosomonas sp. (strain Is79A3) TaxID=261292 RepID=UPI000215CAC0
MRILHVINGELYSGAERVQDLLALRLAEFGYEVSFACIKPDKFPEQRMSKDAPLHMVPMTSRFDLGCGAKLARIVRQQGYRLVHTHTPRAALVGRVASVLAGVPMVHHVHSPTTRDTENAVRNHINALTERMSMAGVARLIPVSNSLEHYLRAAGYATARIRMVANGVPTPGPLLERVLPRDEWVIGCVALFRPRKGIEVLIEAVAHLRDEGRAVRLRAVGPFETLEYEAAIHAQAARLNIASAIDWTGFTRDVNAEFAQMDAFVLPSLFGEGMPMVILEAMAVGVPVIASDVEGIPEVIDHGRSGLIVPHGDARALTGALAALMDGQHDWQAMREAAWQTQSTRFSDRSMAQGVARVYGEVLE